MITLFGYILYIDIYRMYLMYHISEEMFSLFWCTSFFFWLMYNDLARDKKKKVEFFGENL